MAAQYELLKELLNSGTKLSFGQDFFFKFYQAFLLKDRWMQYLNGVGTTLLVTALALALGVGFVPVRKPRKLPRETIAETYELEYGTDQLEIHVDAIKPGDKVLVVDDLLATGGTIDATVKLIRRLGGEVHDAAFIINLFDLGGEQRLEKLGIHCYCLVPFPGH